MRIRSHKKLVREGDYIAEVDVELLDEDDSEPGAPGWGPYLSASDGLKLDDVRNALRRGDLAAAAKLARVYRLMPVPAA